jgi:CRISPR/Cas system-associated protein Csm6
MAKRVVIEVRNGEAKVLYASKGVEVVVKQPKTKKRGFFKRLRTAFYYARKFFRLA